MASFFKKKTPKELAKQTKREIGREQRGLERERAQLDRDEKKLVADIKAAAKRGNNGETKILAKQLVQLRGQRDRLLMTKAQLGAIKTKTSLMATTHTMATAMQGVNKTMVKANKVVSPEKIGKTMREFEQNMARMDMTEEVMNDTLMDAFDDDEMEEDADALARQVLDEIGVDSTAALGVAPSHAPLKQQEEQEANEMAAKLPELPTLEGAS